MRGFKNCKYAVSIYNNRHEYINESLFTSVYAERKHAVAIIGQTLFVKWAYW